MNQSAMSRNQMNKMKDFFIHNTYNASQPNPVSLMGTGSIVNRNSMKKQSQENY